MQTAVILFQILAPETAQLSESLADDPQIRESLIEKRRQQRFFGGLSVASTKPAGVYSAGLLQLCRRLRRRNRISL